MLSTSNACDHGGTAYRAVAMSNKRGRARGRGRPQRVPQVLADTESVDVFCPGSTLLGSDKSTVWTVVGLGDKRPGKASAQNVIKETSGPTPYAKRHIIEGDMISSWKLLISEPILKHIKLCTEAEAQRKGEKDWIITLEELDAFIALLYVRESYKCGGTDYDLLWSRDGELDFLETL